MAEFDPDKFLGKKQGFDPDAYLKTPADIYLSREKEPQREAATRAGMESVGRALAVPGDVLKTAIAQDPRLKALVGGQVPVEDTLRAIQGKGPGGSEYLKRAGVESEKLRNVWGTGLDIGSDIVANQALGSGLSRGMQATGEWLYKLPFRKIDRTLLKQGAKPVSEIFLKEGKVPLTKSGIFDTSEDLLKKISDQRQKIISGVADKKTVGNWEAALRKADEYVLELKQSGSAAKREFAPKFEKMIEAQKTIDVEPGIKQLIEAKTGIGETLPKSAFGQTALPDVEERFFKKMAGGLQKESEAVAEAAIPGQGRALSESNKQIQSLLGARPYAESQALVESGLLPVTQVDLALLAVSPQAAAAKQFGKVMRAPGAYTVPGKLLQKTGQYGETLSPYLAPVPSVWDRINLGVKQ